MSKKAVLVVTLLTLLGGVLRFENFTKNPPSLNIDEVALGYSAYSILKTGRDEFGNFLPISFKSVGDYKNPGMVYLMVPSIELFGLNEFSVRLPGALIGTLTIPLLYLLINKLLKNEKIALVGTALFTISPWHIYFTRYAFESSVAMSFLIIGVWAFLKWLEGNAKWAILSAFFLSFTVYTYHSERLFLPIFLIFLTVIFWKQLNRKKNELVLFLGLIIIICFPMLFFSIFGPGAARAAMTCICNDVNFQRNIDVYSAKLILDKNLAFFNNLSLISSSNVLLFFYWIKKYLAYFQPFYLFYNSLQMTLQSEYSLGVSFFFEIPFIIIGIFTLIKEKFKNKKLIFFWILLGLFPASVTLNDQHPGRSMIILPMLVLISAIGAVRLWRIISNIRQTYLKLSSYVFISLVILWSLAEAWLIFTTHFPKERGEAFMEGSKEAVEYVLAHKGGYNKIVFDPVRGVAGPFVVSIPYMYTLFYSRYDPSLYQHQNEVTDGGGGSGFDKFEFRPINWSVDRYKKGTVFIGSPWALPEKDLKEAVILDKIYLSSGQLAFLIVTPK